MLLFPKNTIIRRLGIDVMKKILLLGDSIRMGYDKYVKDALAGVAEVCYPDENCKFAQYLLRMLHNFKNDIEHPESVALVHWNAGLWDVVEMYGEPPLTSPEQYREMTARIDRLLRFLFPNARLVFATSTSVIEEGFKPVFKRSNANIEKYNEIALGVLSNTDERINDLYSLTKNISGSCRSDATHFNTPEGRKLLGDRVLSVICAELEISAKEINIENFVPENYTDKNIGF